VQFTERLAERVITQFSAVGDTVLDPFAAFGTTAVVAVRLGRRAIAVELANVGRVPRGCARGGGGSDLDPDIAPW
jgi:hypothetical protein